MQNHLKPFGVDVERARVKLIEPQADTVQEVAFSKAMQAYSVLKKPLIVEDGAFVIDELNGFPGPYIKFILKTLGAERLLKFSKIVKAKSARFLDSVVFVDSKGKFKSFDDDYYRGTLANKLDETSNPEIWSDLWRIFIPTGAKKTLSAMSYAERQEVESHLNYKSTFTRFSEWYKKRL